ncbi:MAG: hypothetical protein WCF16_04815, partial [Alphaproteobacteria bacterium]
MTGVLAQMGIAAGDDLLAPVDNENPRGFWENRSVVMVHERLLKEIGSRWDDTRPLPDEWWVAARVAAFREELLGIVGAQFGDEPIWILKDPRMCRLLPLWLDLCNKIGVELGFVNIFRQPFEVGLSLERRNGHSFEKSALLWLTHNLEAEFWSRGYPRTFVRYRHLLFDPKGVVTRVGRDLNVRWPKGEVDGLQAVLTFMEPSLRHHSAELDDRLLGSGFLSDLVLDTWKALTEAAAEGRTADEARFDGLRARLAEYSRSTDTDFRGLRTRLLQRIRRIAVSVSECGGAQGAN